MYRSINCLVPHPLHLEVFEHSMRDILLDVIRRGQASQPQASIVYVDKVPYMFLHHSWSYIDNTPSGACFGSAFSSASLPTRCPAVAPYPHIDDNILSLELCDRTQVQFDIHENPGL